MIANELRQLVEKTFADDPEFCEKVILSLALNENVVFLGQKLNREQWEMAALKQIQKARESGIVPDGSLSGPSRQIA
jgi:hypothetical protein